MVGREQETEECCDALVRVTGELHFGKSTGWHVRSTTSHYEYVKLNTT